MSTAAAALTPALTGALSPAAPKPSPAPAYDPTGGWGTVMPYGSTIALVGGAVLVLVLLVLGLLVLRAPRAGMAGKAQLRRRLGPAAMHRGADELRPGGPSRPAGGGDTRPVRPAHAAHAAHAEKNATKGDPRCVATERH